MFYVQTMYNYHVSLGTVFNILDNAADKALYINQSYDLSQIKDRAADELFHWGSPILAAVDIPSRFCALLAKADSRDYETWGIHLLDLIEQSHPPETRAELYDFIVAEMAALALKHPHRIDYIVTSLKNRREALLNVSIALNKKFEALASQYNVSIETIWTICYSARYDIDSVKC